MKLTATLIILLPITSLTYANRTPAWTELTLYPSKATKTAKEENKKHLGEMINVQMQLAIHQKYSCTWLHRYDCNKN